MDPSLIAKLHPLERKVLPILKSHTELTQIMHASGLQEIEVLRALQWLENKNVLKINSSIKTLVVLDTNGVQYKQHHLPERSFLNVLTEEYQSAQLLAKKANLSQEELSVCLGQLKRKAAIEISKDKDLVVKLNQQGKKLQLSTMPEELFLQQEFPLELEAIKDLNLLAFNELKKRKEIIKVDEQKIITITLTEEGHQLTHANIKEDVVNRLTKDMLKTGNWKKKDFRAYDIEINVPHISAGKKHFDNQALEYIKRIWLDLGFAEMTGNYVQSAFWDLDALFVPQDHPAREMQDTFYLEGKAKLPKIIEKIKEVHETGGNTGSTGWNYTFSKEESEKILLRTHTTVLSARKLSQLKKEDLPVKLFSVNRVFRNEALDWKHLFEFYQVEGIVIDPNANLQHLKGYLREFYLKMGYTDVKMTPSHFPYTEPSLEISVFHPVKKEWVELGGAGIFRPEVVKPLLGFDCPVLAWGQGMGRIIGEYWKLNDIRDLYKNDLKQLREIKMWMK